VRTLISVIALLAAQTPALAQGGAAVEGLFRLEIMRPMLDEAPFVGEVGGWVIMPEAIYPLGRSRARFDLPISLGSGGGESGLHLGNPYLGIEAYTGNTTINFGVRVPLSPIPDNPGELLATDLALLADFERFEAYMPKLFSALIRVSGERRSSSGLLATGHFGGVFMASTEGGDPEALLDYGAAIGVGGPRGRGTAGVDGRLVLTADGDFGERSVHFFNLRFAYSASRLRPFGLLRVPLENDADPLNWVLGLGVELLLR